MLINSAEQVVRSSCTTLPLLGEKGHDIRSCTAELGAAMVNELQFDATVFGINVQRVAIVEARYAHEISAQMLMKQQAVAMVDARKSAWRRLRERGGGRALCVLRALPLPSPRSATRPFYSAPPTTLTPLATRPPLRTTARCSHRGRRARNRAGRAAGVPHAVHRGQGAPDQQHARHAHEPPEPLGGHPPVYVIDLMSRSQRRPRASRAHSQQGLRRDAAP